MLKRAGNFFGWIFFSLLFSATAAAKSDVKFTQKNELYKPQHFREWVYIGTALTPHDKNNGKAPFPEFHNIYINRLGWKQWKKTGKFTDGTVIVKELMSVGATEGASGKGYFQGHFSGVAVAVKDKKRFSSKPGNWGYYVFGSNDLPNVKGNAFDDKSCAPCHSQHAQKDMVFTQYYPILNQAVLNQAVLNQAAINLPVIKKSVEALDKK